MWSARGPPSAGGAIRRERPRRPARARRALAWRGRSPRRLRPGEHSAVDLEILGGRSLPAKVARHRLAHHRPPARLLAVLVEGAHGGAHEITRRIVVEQ